MESLQEIFPAYRRNIVLSLLKNLLNEVYLHFLKVVTIAHMFFNKRRITSPWTSLPPWSDGVEIKSIPPGFIEAWKFLNTSTSSRICSMTSTTKPNRRISLMNFVRSAIWNFTFDAPTDEKKRLQSSTFLLYIHGKDVTILNMTIIPKWILPESSTGIQNRRLFPGWRFHSFSSLWICQARSNNRSSRR